MAEVLAQKGPVIHAEQLSLGASAETLSDAGATIPETCGEVIVVTPSGDSLHMAPSVTPTSTLGRKITLGHPGHIPHPMISKMKLVSDDGADVACVLIYMRGSGRQDLASSRSEPR